MPIQMVILLRQLKSLQIQLPPAVVEGLSWSRLQLSMLTTQTLAVTGMGPSILTVTEMGLGLVPLKPSVMPHPLLPGTPLPVQTVPRLTRPDGRI